MAKSVTKKDPRGRKKLDKNEKKRGVPIYIIGKDITRLGGDKKTREIATKLLQDHIDNLPAE